MADDLQIARRLLEKSHDALTHDAADTAALQALAHAATAIAAALQAPAGGTTGGVEGSVRRKNVAP